MRRQLVIILLLVFTVTACKTSKMLDRPTKVNVKIKNELYKDVLDAQPQLNTINFSRITLELSQNNLSFSVKGSMKVVVDKAIYLSVQPMLGFEVARIEITPDTVLIVDKMNKKYFLDTFSFFAKKIGVPVNFYNFQAILLNQLFVLGETTPQDSTLKKFVEQPFPDGRSLVLAEGKSSSTHYFVMNEFNRITLAKLYHADTNSEFTCDYSLFKQEGDILYPSSYKLNAISGRKSGDLLVDVDKVEFNTQFALIKTDISNYTKVKFEQIIP